MKGLETTTTGEKKKEEGKPTEKKEAKEQASTHTAKRKKEGRDHHLKIETVSSGKKDSIRLQKRRGRGSGRTSRV